MGLNDRTLVVAEEKKIAVHTELPARCETPVDRTRMRQVFANLLDNAIKYTPEGGQVIVSVGEESGQAVARFRDNGIGIPAEEQPKIFDRFYRVDKSRSKTSGGTGLGLSIASLIAEQHDSKIQLASISGEGTTVTVRIPLLADEE